MSAWSRVLALALVTQVAGCNQVSWRHPTTNGSLQSPIKTYVCIDLPTERRPGAIEAIRLWDRALGQWQHMVPVGGQQEPCGLWVHETTFEDPSDSDALAWASMVGGREISLVKGRYEQDVTGILLHEIGHALGAQHVPGTLMNPRWTPGEFTCPDATTVAQVAAWNKVDLGLLQWCWR